MNPRRNYRFFLHRDHFTKCVDLSSTRGLEIGAHDLAMVEPDEGKCDFADFRTTGELIDLAERQEGHNPEYVVPVKYDLRNGYQSIGDKYDWIVAAHVVEHIPDLIGWINTLSGLLKTGGLVFLVIPDRRFTFDYHRRVTTFSDVVETHRNRLTIPSFAQVFDHHYYTHDNIDPGMIWQGHPVPPPKRDYQGALGAAERALLGFEDAHCSVFTPESFTALMNDMMRSGLIKMHLQDMRATGLHQLDFSAVLKVN